MLSYILTRRRSALTEAFDLSYRRPKALGMDLDAH